jgi:uncharacterized protein
MEIRIERPGLGPVWRHFPPRHRRPRAKCSWECRGENCNNLGMDADALIAMLALAPHPEGGHYRETWADVAGTAIYFLLRAGERSAWHRVHERAEIWHFYAGAPLELSVNEGGREGATRTALLGPDLSVGEQPQAVVPAGAWQCARSSGAWSLVGCTVAPPFSFDSFELAPGDRLPG